MATEYSGIPYFPIYTNFFESDVLEILEAKYGIRASCITLKLLCKIYSEGYFIPWGNEQCIIFVRKIGGEVEAETMNQIIELLFEKNFFHKQSYEQYGILTSESIQKVWLEATARRKRKVEELPYLLTSTDGTKRGIGKQNEDMKGLHDNSLSAQDELKSENANNFRQSKLNKSKADIEDELEKDSSSEIPAYAYNTATHNFTGLMDSLERCRVTDTKEKRAIFRLSDFGRKGTPVWKLFANTNWSKINTPGRYIIAALLG